jgi:hypothetical protein
MAAAEQKRPREDKKRHYDKGERRFKHVGRGPDPVIDFDDSQPKKWVGKCPSTLSEVDRRNLLNEAIAAPTATENSPLPRSSTSFTMGRSMRPRTATKVGAIMGIHIGVNYQRVF